MREAAAKLKDVVSKKDIIPLLTHYIAKDGFLYASDGFVEAGLPVDYKGTFAVRGYDFHQFLSKTPGEVKITVLDNFHVKVSSGRYRTTIPGSDVGSHNVNPPKGKEQKLDSNFIQKLRAIRPFLSDNATQAWAACAFFEDDNIVATNNVVIVKASGTGFKRGHSLLMPFNIVDYVLANSAGLSKLIFNDVQAGFVWEDKSWVNSRLLAQAFPNTAPVFEQIPGVTWKLTPEWREAYLHIASMSEGEIQIYADRITGNAKDTLHEAEVPCPIPLPAGRERMSFSEKYFTPVIDSATHLTFFEANGPRAAFKSDHLIGMVAGMGR